METFGCWKAKRPGEIREPVAWRGGGEKEGRGARRMDSPVSHSLADRERITMRSLPLLVSLLVLLSDRPFAHPSPSLSLSPHVQVCPPVHPIVSSSASCHSPRQPLPTLLSHQEFISSPVPCLVLLLRCSFCSHPPSLSLFLLVTLLLSFILFFLLIPSGSKS